MLPPAQTLPRPAWKDNLLLYLPRVAMLVLLTALGGLLILMNSDEREKQRNALIADLLWAEQNLRFHLESNEETLGQLADELTSHPDPKERFHLLTQHLIKNNPELSHILWLSHTGKSVASSGEASDLEHHVVNESEMRAAIERSQKMGQVVYLRPHSNTSTAGNYNQRVRSQDYHFQVIIPIQRNGQFHGVLIGNYGLQALVNELIPWWYAQKYQFRILDINEQELASKSAIAGDPRISHQIAFDPPGGGTLLNARAYPAVSTPGERFLIGLVFLLSIMVLWSLWGIHIHMRKRIRTEQELRSAHSFRQAMEDSLINGLRARDLQGQLIYVNPAFCHMVGYSAEELVGVRPPMPYWDPDDIEETLHLHEMVLSGQAPREGFELRLKRKNGERFDALVHEAPLIDGNGQHIGWMGSVIDITERKRAAELERQRQEKLQHTARLVVLGEMASSLAHELNQPLAAIRTYAGGLLTRQRQGTLQSEDLEKVLEKVAAQSERAGQIIRQMHNFAKKRAPELLPCHLGDIVREALDLFEPQARDLGVHFEFHEERLADNASGKSALPLIQGDRTMLGQVVINLIKNAAEAVSSLPQEERIVTLQLHYEAESAVLEVCDPGPGIAEELRAQLFSPFVSSKEEGLGMGLAICRSAVEFHRGQLDVESSLTGRVLSEPESEAEKDSGRHVTCFRVRLPRYFPSSAPFVPEVEPPCSP